jgi:prolyl-tRNA synthetase
MANDKAEREEKKGLSAKKESSFSEWYTQVIERTDFVDYTSVSGCIAFRPNAYFAWEQVQKATDSLFGQAGIQNVYFPMLIPEHLLDKEKEHVKGFSPEVAWVTHTGNSKLEERLAIRPTSETVMYERYAKWIRSWRDLPMRYNQWNSVLRWEFKHPTPLLRSREFLWNEGHTVFATRDEEEAERDLVLGIYSRVLEDVLALPGVVGKKTDSEKFAGAEASYSIEHLMPDGWAIQGPDFHVDGQRFAKAFDITFINKEGKKEYAYQNTFAISTRELGAMLAVHGDDKGLVLPPALARVQAVIVPIYNDGNKELVIRHAKELEARVAKTARVYLDGRETYSPGWKFNEWEMNGTPVRIEIGERDIKEGKAVLARRDTGAKESVELSKAEKRIGELLEGIQKALYAKAKKQLDDNTHRVDSYDEAKRLIKGKGGFVQAGWCGSEECESKVKEETGAKITNMPFDAQHAVKGKRCIACGSAAKYIANFARSY